MKPGNRVAYVPLHAAGDITHPDVELGTITSIGMVCVFVRFDSQPADAPGRACGVEDLRLIEPEKMTADDLWQIQLGRDGALLCKCGDERRDHPNDGECNLNGLGHGIPSSELEARCLGYKPVK